MTTTGVALNEADRLSQLTAKEQACLRLVGRHMSSKEIAATLGIAKTSVDTYCNRARAKLGVTDRFEAARLLLARDREFESRPAGRRGAAPADPPRLLEPPRQSAPVLTLMVGLALVVMLGVAGLLAGLHALELMKPLPAAQGRPAAKV